MDGLVLLAAGPSRRFGGSVSKVLRRLAGTPVLVRALAPFLVGMERMALVIVARPGDHPTIKRLLPRAKVVAGGTHRVESLRQGIAALPEGVDVVLVHDAARPLATADLVRRVLAAARRDGAAAPILGVRDPLHEVTESPERGKPTLVGASIDRRRIGAAQSPQGAKIDRLRDALAKARDDGYEPEDEVALLHHADVPVTAVRGHPHNVRITVRDDLVVAEGLLRKE
jgi:2-C-methyl-D-erythritol 4-phosphate cytidylyltransferase